MAAACKTITLSALSLALLLFVVLPGALVVLVDPAHIFHKPTALFPHGFSRGPAYQIAGLINSHLADPHDRHNAIIVGSSLTENFKPEYLAERTGLSGVLKLTMMGAIPREQNAFVRHALSTQRLTHVFWEVHPYFYRMPGMQALNDMEKAGRVPPYLYNSSRLDDYRYIFNASTLKDTLEAIRQPELFQPDINRLGYWENECKTTGICEHYYSADAIAAIQRDYAPVTRSWKASNGTHDYSEVDRLLLNLVLEHCNGDVKFYLFFPPTSLLWSARMQEEDFDYDLYMLRHVIEKTQSCRNVRVFSFMNELWITADLSNYHDPRHFFNGVQEYMADSMATGKHRINPQDLEAFEKTFVQNINEYRPYGTILHPH